MATKSLTDYLLKSPPLSGGGFGISQTTPAVMPNTYVSPGSIKAAVAPVAPPPPPPVSPVAPVVPSSTPLFSGGGAPTGPTGPTAPIGPTAPTGASGPTGSGVPPQYLNPDGSFKSPDQVAADVAATLKAAHSTGDIGKLALEQFGATGGSTADAEAEARRITNTRNDISVGQADPYKVAGDSGIAYTPAELSAIQQAYAGVYDPALDTALAKVTSKQADDKAAAASAATIAQQKAAPYTLGANDTRYDGQGNIIASGNGGGSTPTTYVKGANPVVDSYITGFQNGTYKAADIPDAYKDLVAQGIAAATGEGAPLSKTSTDALGIIASLQALPDLGALSGTGIVGGIEHPSSLFPGTAVQNAQNLAKQLQATISLANRQQLKGSGAISDFEFKVLGDAATALGLDGSGRTNLSPADFADQLGKLQLKLQVGPTSLTDDEIQYLASPAGGGYTPDQIRAYSAQQSFNDVGNTKASTLSTTAGTGKGNRPQRNNNPGDLKTGGLADALAIGVDPQGHLIFPDKSTGLKALTADLTAKINGGSARLPKNPTIAQLGAVYAEDPNWPKKVASILGVTTDTHTTAVPIDALVKAVATQEGFYA